MTGEPRPCRHVPSRYRAGCGIVVHSRASAETPPPLRLEAPAAQNHVCRRPQDALGPAGADTAPSVRTPLSSSRVYLPVRDVQAANMQVHGQPIKVKRVPPCFNAR